MASVLRVAKCFAIGIALPRSGRREDAFMPGLAYAFLNGAAHSQSYESAGTDGML